MISHVAVVIPARNEEARISECLQAILAARDRASVSVTVTVAADCCQDNTAEVARGFPGVDVIEIDAGNVGIARKAATDYALRRREVPFEFVWLAHTDADSVVPPRWIVSQIDLANDGYDVIIGTVRPDPREYPLSHQTLWEATHIEGKPNGHVHGANLGVRASAYVASGGCMPLAEHEDVDLVCRLSGYRQIASDDAEVITSARLEGRTPGGYASFLRGQISEFTLPSIATDSVRKSIPTEVPHIFQDRREIWPI